MTDTPNRLPQIRIPFLNAVSHKEPKLERRVVPEIYHIGAYRLVPLMERKPAG